MSYDGSHSWPMSDLSEREFWGIHEFHKVADSLGCGQCGWSYDDPIHFYLEKKAMDALARLTESLGLYESKEDSEGKAES